MWTLIKMAFRAVTGGITSLVTGPLGKIGEAYVKGRNDVKLREIEARMKREFLRQELKKEMLTDDGRRQELAAAILRRDRGDHRTSWIRPVTAGLSIFFWVCLVLSQVSIGGNGILPIIWHMPPGALGTVMVAFPATIIATFGIARPIEKYWNSRNATV